MDARTLTFKHGEDLHLERLNGHPASKRAPLKRDDGKQYLKVRIPLSLLLILMQDLLNLQHF